MQTKTIEKFLLCLFTAVCWIMIGLSAVAWIVGIIMIIKNFNLIALPLLYALGILTLIAYKVNEDIL